jgi:tetratricopeptide (TPR) repeat protein
LSRFPEGLEEIATAESIYDSFRDRRRLVRARVLRAILLNDAGYPDQALLILEPLLSDTDAIADQPIYALLYLTYATTLVFSGDLSRAKAAYARTTKLLRATGQDREFFRVRVGLADIAHREGRIADALELNLELRLEFQHRHLPWDEVRRELWIIRELLELDRFAEARETCQELARRAESLSLRSEARRALTYLGDAEHALDVAMVTAVEDDLQRILRGDLTRWSAA